MPIDWNVPTNRNGAPVGFVCLTSSAVPGLPFYVSAKSVSLAQEDGPNTAVVIGLTRVVVKENIREVFRLVAEADTVEGVKPVSSPPAVFADKPDRIRKKA